MKTEDLVLSMRAYKALKATNIESVNELISLMICKTPTQIKKELSKMCEGRYRVGLVTVKGELTEVVKILLQHCEIIDKRDEWLDSQNEKDA